MIAGGVQRLTVQPATASLRTGDVVRYNASVLPAGLAQTAVRWSVSGDAASIDADGVFVAERPGTYVVTAAAGNRAASASVIVLPRNVQRTLEVVGRTPIEEFQTLEQWIVGNYAYVDVGLRRTVVGVRCVQSICSRQSGFTRLRRTRLRTTSAPPPTVGLP